MHKNLSSFYSRLHYFMGFISGNVSGFSKKTLFTYQNEGKSNSFKIIQSILFFLRFVSGKTTQCTLCTEVLSDDLWGGKQTILVILHSSLPHRKTSKFSPLSHLVSHKNMRHALCQTSKRTRQVHETLCLLSNSPNSIFRN